MISGWRMSCERRNSPPRPCAPQRMTPTATGNAEHARPPPSLPRNAPTSAPSAHPLPACGAGTPPAACAARWPLAARARARPRDPLSTVTPVTVPSRTPTQRACARRSAAHAQHRRTSKRFLLRSRFTPSGSTVSAGVAGDALAASSASRSASSVSGGRACAVCGERTVVGTCTRGDSFGSMRGCKGQALLPPRSWVTAKDALGEHRGYGGCDKRSRLGHLREADGWIRSRENRGQVPPAFRARGVCGSAADGDLQRSHTIGLTVTAC